MTPRFPFSFKLSLLKIDLGFALLRIFQQGCASHWWPVEILLWAGCTENMNSRSSNIRLWLLDLDFWWMSIEMSIEHLMREDELWFLAVRGAARRCISGCSSRLPRSPVLARQPSRHHLLYRSVSLLCQCWEDTLHRVSFGTPPSSLSVPPCFRQVWSSTRMWDHSWQNLVGVVRLACVGQPVQMMNNVNLKSWRGEPEAHLVSKYQRHNSDGLCEQGVKSAISYQQDVMKMSS